MLALGVHGVAGHNGVGLVGESVQQRLEAGDLVRLVPDVHLGEDQAAGVVECGQQVDLAAASPGGAAQAIAVHCHRPPGLRTGLEAAVGQAPTARSSASASRRARVRRMVVSHGTGRVPLSGQRRAPRPVQDRRRRIGGVGARQARPGQPRRGGPRPARGPRTQPAQTPSVPARNSRRLHSGHWPGSRRASVTLTSRSP